MVNMHHFTINKLYPWMGVNKLNDLIRIPPNKSALLEVNMYLHPAGILGILHILQGEECV